MKIQMFGIQISVTQSDTQTPETSQKNTTGAYLYFDILLARGTPIIFCANDIGVCGFVYEATTGKLLKYASPVPRTTLPVHLCEETSVQVGN